MLKIRSIIGFKEMQEKFIQPQDVREEKKENNEEMMARRNTLR